jgi:hypothetical protein
MKRFLVAFAAIVLCTLLLPQLFVAHSHSNSSAPPANQSTGRFNGSSRPIANQYIVSFSDDLERTRIDSRSRNLVRLYGGRIMFIYKDAINRCHCCRGGWEQ